MLAAKPTSVFASRRPFVLLLLAWAAAVQLKPSAMTRQLRRLRALRLIKKVTNTYRYYLTRMGRAAIAAACSLTRFNVVPAMAAAH